MPDAGASTATAEQPDDLPEWAYEWLPGASGCGSRLVRPACYCGGHVACASSGWSVEKCPDASFQGSTAAADL